MLKPFLLSLLLLVCGCATVPMAALPEDAAGKAFPPPPPGMGSLYVFRTSDLGGTRTINVSAGQRMLGDLAGATWFQVAVNPGTYDIRCRAENSASQPVAIAAGEIRYVEIEIRVGLMAPRCGVAEVAAETGRAAIVAGNRAADIK